MQETLQDANLAEAKGRPYFEQKLLTSSSSCTKLRLEHRRRQRRRAETFIQQSQEVSDLRTQVETTGTLYDINKFTDSPEVEEIYRHRALQVDTMGDSLGYVGRVNREVEDILKNPQGRSAEQVLSDAEAIPNSPPAADSWFNAPELKRSHLTHSINAADLSGDETRQTQAEQRLSMSTQIHLRTDHSGG